MNIRQKIFFPKTFFLTMLYKERRSKGVGQSPLRIPDWVVALMFLFAFGTVFFGSSYLMSFLVNKVEENLKTVVIIRSSIEEDSEYGHLTEMVKQFLASMFSEIPNITKNRKVRSETTALNDDLKNSFGNSSNLIIVDVEGLFNFAKSSSTRSDLDFKKFLHLIIGDPEGRWLPIFKQYNEKAVMDSLGIIESSMDNTVEDPDHWRYEIIRSAIGKLRSHLTSEPYYPGRILQAFGGLAGYIQWTTITFALWCFLLLAALRIPWAKIQTRLVNNGYLPWDKTLPSGIWDISNTRPAEQSYLKYLTTSYPNSFMVGQLLTDVFRDKEQKEPLNITQDKPAVPSTAELIRLRIQDYQNEASNENGIITYILSVIPILGFLGTVLGLILTMSNISELLVAVEGLDKIEVLKQLGSYLGSAFDTTFFALFSLIPLEFLRTQAIKSENRLFALLKHQALKFIPPLWERESEEQNFLEARP